MQANVETAGVRAARGRDGDPLTAVELRAWRGMLAAHASMVRRLDADLRAHHGLSLTSYEVLMLLGRSPSRRMRISELSGATLLSVSGVSRMVDRLARQGLVEKEACEEDGRGAQAVLTAMGRGRVRAGFLERFDDAELEALGGFWDRVVPAEP
jgi:DNA-binding MarR family transcriptional regulator